MSANETYDWADPVLRGLPATVEPPPGYADYLRSGHWLHMRGLAVEHYGRTCFLCGTDRDINIHHRSYARLGRERLSDLTILCRDCHARHHGKPK